MRCVGNRAGGTVGIAPRRRSSLRKSRKGLRRGKKLVAVAIRRSLADYIGTHREKCLQMARGHCKVVVSNCGPAGLRVVGLKPAE